MDEKELRQMKTAVALLLRREERQREEIKLLNRRVQLLRGELRKLMKQSGT